MAYKIVHESDTIHIVQPKHWWSILSLKDLVRALGELDGVVSVTRCWSWGDTRYIVVTRK